MKVERAFLQDVTTAIPFSADLALLKLAEEVDLSVHTPACLPAPGRDYTGMIGSVYGEQLLSSSCTLSYPILSRLGKNCSL